MQLKEPHSLPESLSLSAAAPTRGILHSHHPSPWRLSHRGVYANTCCSVPVTLKHLWTTWEVEASCICSLIFGQKICVCARAHARAHVLPLPMWSTAFLHPMGLGVLVSNPHHTQSWEMALPGAHGGSCCVGSACSLTGSEGPGSPRAVLHLAPARRMASCCSHPPRGTQPPAPSLSGSGPVHSLPCPSWLQQL